MKHRDLDRLTQKNFDCTICRDGDGKIGVFDSFDGFTGYETLFDEIIKNYATCLIESIGEKEPMVLMSLKKYMEL